MNGLGVAQFGVSPFIMTLGLQSIGAGAALFLTGGVPVSGLPYDFGNFFGFGRVFGVPVPVLFAIVAIVVMWLIMNRTRFGAHVYAVGGNLKAANLSGVNTKKVLFFAYMLCALLASVAGVLMTARVESGRNQSRRHASRSNRSPPASSPVSRCGAASAASKTSCSARSSSSCCRTA